MGFDDFATREIAGQMALMAGLLAAVTIGAAVVQGAAKKLLKVAGELGTMPSRCGLTGAAVAQRLLTACGLNQVRVVRSMRQDHYHPWWREVRLNQLTHDSPTLAALAVAAHEVGHAEQFAARTTLCRCRNIAWPICYLLVAAAFLPPLLSICGLTTSPLLDMTMVLIPVSLLILLLQVPIHLPLEKDATQRARRLVTESGLLGAGELAGFDRLLSAAWWTHFAADVQRCMLVLLGLGVTWWTVSNVDTFGPDAAAITAVAVAPPEPVLPTQPVPLPGSPSHLPPPDAWDPSMPIPTYGEDVIRLSLWALPALLALYWCNKVLSRMTTTKPTLPLPLQCNNAGVSLLEAGDMAGAIDAFTDTLRADPNYVSALLNRAHVYILLERLDDALRDYDEAVRLAPDSALPLEHRAQVLWARRDYDHAIDDFSAVLQRDPVRGSAYRDRGLMRYFQGDYERSLADSEEAIRLDPADSAAFNNRGATLIETGDYARAVDDLNRAIRLDPAFAHPYKNLASLQAACPDEAFRDGAAAVANATKALDLAEWKATEWFVILAAAYAENSQFEEAVRWQTRFINEGKDAVGDDAAEDLALYHDRQALRERSAEAMAMT